MSHLSLEGLARMGVSFGNRRPSADAFLKKMSSAGYVDPLIETFLENKD